MAGNGEIEWVDANASPGPADVIDTRPPQRPRWRWWYALIALAIVAAILVATRPSHSNPSAQPSTSPSPSPTRSVSSPAAAANPAGTGSPTTTLGHPLVDVPAGWVLFGRGSDSVVSIALATGQVTTTPIPLLSSSGPSSFVVGPDRVVVRPLDVVAGYQVRDGHSFEPLPDNFPTSGPALPGPDPTHLWVPGANDQTMTLIDFNGSPTGSQIILPPEVDAGSVGSDGAGYVQFGSVGGVYDARPSGISRITTGELLAIGPTTWITDECDAQDHCSTAVINSRTGARHTLNVSPDEFGNGGYVSPDGSTVAAFEGNDSQPVRLHLINLTTGADRMTDVTLDPNLNYQDGLFAWSPDSHWIFATNGTGRLYALDTRTTTTTTLDVTLGPVSQVALRATAG